MPKNLDNPMLEDQMQDCTNDCFTCHTVCLDTAMRVLQQSDQQQLANKPISSPIVQQGGQHADAVRLLLDCSEICLTAAHFMLRNSPLYGYICQACAQVCSHCAGICSQIGETDGANACQACATSCQQMVKMIA